MNVINSVCTSSQSSYGGYKYKVMNNLSVIILTNL